MNIIEERILKNQMGIMWTLSHLLKLASPTLVGRNGALDQMCDDLATASKETKTVMELKL